MRLIQLVPLVLLIGSGVSAASVFSRPPQNQVAEFSGTVDTVDAVSLRVRTDEEGPMTFVVDDPASLPLGLVAGTRVSVKCEMRQGGGRRLVSVGLAAEPARVGEPTAAAGTPEATAPTEIAAASATPSGAPLDATPAASQARDEPGAPGTAAPAASGPCPLQLVALVLLVATGGLLVIASWR
jgi:hypothetical protein